MTTATITAPKRSFFRTCRAKDDSSTKYQAAVDECRKVADAARNIVEVCRAQQERLQKEIADLNAVKRLLSDELARLRANAPESDE